MYGFDIPAPLRLFYYTPFPPRWMIQGFLFDLHFIFQPNPFSNGGYYADIPQPDCRA